MTSKCVLTMSYCTTRQPVTSLYSQGPVTLQCTASSRLTASRYSSLQSYWSAAARMLTAVPGFSCERMTCMCVVRESKLQA